VEQERAEVDAPTRPRSSDVDAARQSGGVAESEIYQGYGGEAGEKGDGDDCWEAHFEILRTFQIAHGHAHVRQDDGQLGVWTRNQRVRMKRNKLSNERVRRMRELGFDFDGVAAAQKRAAFSGSA